MTFTVSDKNESSKVTVKERDYKKGVKLIDIDIEFENAHIPSPVSVKWSIDCVDVYSTWGAFLGFERIIGPSWHKKVSRSRLASGAPLHELISFEGNNCMTIATSDAETPTDIATGVCEETAGVHCEVKFFTSQINSIREYHATIYIDMNKCPYYESLKAAEEFWSNECGYRPAYIPEYAKYPMYSCWYSFHQNIDTDAIENQCKLAKELGMRSVIVDDGWQTNNLNRGYSYCGDWEAYPSKVKNMKDFVDRVHKVGMKFILWYSVPYVGKFSKAFEQYKDMLLGYAKDTPQDGWAVFDPRFPEVRKYLTGVYVNSAKNWGLDGLKLDFIDSFRIFADTKSYDPRWDTLSLEDGVDKLLSEVTSALRSINPEILIEFRQSYFGPAIRKYGNMIRVRDCPNDSLMNHVYGTDLKFTLNKTPIHSDMLMWNNNDTVESAAHQVICSLFCVPQISVMIDKLPQAHYRMLAFWLKYWNENRDVLLDGNFSAESPEHLYSLVKSENDGHIIAAAHSNPLLSVDSFIKLDFINASPSDILIIRCKTENGQKSYITTDCMGNITDKGTVNMTASIHGFNVPPCGMIRIY